MSVSTQAQAWSRGSASTNKNSTKGDLLRSTQGKKSEDTDLIDMSMLDDDTQSFTNFLHDYFSEIPGDTCGKFLAIMKDFTDNRATVQDVLQRVELLLKGHPKLQVAFNALLPPDHGILLHTSKVTPDSDIHAELAAPPSCDLSLPCVLLVDQETDDSIENAVALSPRSTTDEEGLNLGEDELWGCVSCEETNVHDDLDEQYILGTSSGSDEAVISPTHSWMNPQSLLGVKKASNVTLSLDAKNIAVPAAGYDLLSSGIDSSTLQIARDAATFEVKRKDFKATTDFKRRKMGRLMDENDASVLNKKLSNEKVNSTKFAVGVAQAAEAAAQGTHNVMYPSMSVAQKNASENHIAAEPKIMSRGRILSLSKRKVQLVHINVKTAQLHRNRREAYIGTRSGDSFNRSSRKRRQTDSADHEFLANTPTRSRPTQRNMEAPLISDADAAKVKRTPPVLSAVAIHTSTLLNKLMKEEKRRSMMSSKTVITEAGQLPPELAQIQIEMDHTIDKVNVSLELL